MQWLGFFHVLPLSACTRTHNNIGVPRESQFGDMNSGPATGEVTLEVKTVTSGVDNQNQDFRFIITPVLDGEDLDPIPFDSFEYHSGTFESITVSGLEPGRTYSFSATAMNVYGTSSSTNSPLVSAGMSLTLFEMGVKELLVVLSMLA